MKLTCLATNSCPAYLLIIVKSHSFFSNEATGVRKSRGFAKPFAPIINENDYLVASCEKINKVNKYDFNM